MTMIKHALLVRTSLQSTLLAGLMLMPVCAHAQSPQTGASDTASAQELEAANPSDEIVVTANKREQNLRDVGLTVSVLSANELKERNVISLADVAAIVPGLSYSTTESNTPVFTLRGVGFNEASLSAYPTVSVYSDEAPLAFPVLSAQGAFDLQRIEVLKGPQGTLFGQNSTGGAINYIAEKPTDQLSAGLNLGYGRFETVQADGFVSGPITDTLKVRLAGHLVHGGDWQKSYTRDDGLGKSRVYAGRFITDWNPLPAARFALTVTAWKDNSDPQAGQYIALFPQVAGVPIPLVTQQPFSPMNNRAADWGYGQTITPSGMVANPTPFSHRRFLEATLRGDIDIAKSVTFTSLTSLIRFRQHQAMEYDGIPANDDDFPVNNGNIHTFFQEFRLANSGDQPVQWILGANYQKSKIRELIVLTYVDSGANIPAFNNINTGAYKSRTSREDYAFFGNIESEIAPHLTLKGGARYSHNKASQYSCSFDYGDGNIAGFWTILQRSFPGNENLPPIQPGDCISLDSQGVAGPFNDTLKEDSVSWSTGLNYKIDARNLLYANISRGYKAGSYPTLSATFQVQDLPVTQESVTAYEAGFKLTPSRSLALDGAAFYYDYSDKQIRGKVLDPTFGILNGLVNVPKSRVYGAELSANLRPFAGLSLNAGVTYLNSKVQRYSGPNALGQQQDFAGSALPFTPKWEETLGGKYSWSIGEARPFIGANFSVRSKTVSYLGGRGIMLPATSGNATAPGAERPFAIKGYNTLDLSAGVDLKDGKIHAVIWGKNVLNTYYWTTVISAYDTIYRITGRPATWGITIGYKY
jgi:outer membrane receptor protein involved in Fe transport